MDISYAGSDFIQRTVETYSNMILRIAYQNTQNQADAEDTAQEVFLKLMKQNSFQDEAHMKAWLIRVTINQCRSLKRSFWHKKTVALTEEWAINSEDENVFIDLGKLPKNYRNVLYLYYYEEYNVPEIAEILCQKVNTVSSWLTRARKQLKTQLTEGADK